MRFKQIIINILSFFLSCVLKTNAVTVLVLLVWIAGLTILKWEERRGITSVVPESNLTSLRQDLLGYRIIDMEVQAGLATEPEKARLVLAALLNDARAISPPSTPTVTTVREYFKSIAELIDRHFYFRRSTTFTAGLLSGGLDCDLRSLLYQTIAADSGFDIGVIYSPGHAFVGWQAEGNGVSVYWETTVKNGRVARLSNTSTYQDSEDPGDYKLLSRHDSEDLYASWLFSEAYQRNKNPVHLRKVLEIAEKFPTWHFPQVMKLHSLFNAYGIEHSLTRSHLQTYINMNGNDPAGKRMLMRYYKAKGEHGKALDVFYKIGNSAIEPEDFDFAKEVTDSTIDRMRYSAFSVVFKSLQKFKRAFFQKTLLWPEIKNLWEIILMLSISWVIFPYLSRFLKHGPNLSSSFFSRLKRFQRMSR